MGTVHAVYVNLSFNKSIQCRSPIHKTSFDTQTDEIGRLKNDSPLKIGLLFESKMIVFSDRSAGSSKIRLLQCYLLLWINVIDAICIHTFDARQQAKTVQI